MSSRSAYGLEVDRPGTDWRRRGLCAQPGVDADLWHRVTPNASALARHICGHCPVLRECRAEAEKVPVQLRRTSVWGGVGYNTDGRVADWQPIAMRCGWCRGG